MIYQRVGDLAAADGDGFRFERVGSLKIFKQLGKIKSRRLVRVAIKKLEDTAGNIIYFDKDGLQSR